MFKIDGVHVMEFFIKTDNHIDSIRKRKLNRLFESISSSNGSISIRTNRRNEMKLD